MHEAVVLGVQIKIKATRVEGRVIKFNDHWAARAGIMVVGRQKHFFGTQVPRMLTGEMLRRNQPDPKEWSSSTEAELVTTVSHAKLFFSFN